MLSRQNANVKAGKLFCISRGEYSDYRYEGHFLALQDISRAMFQEVADECKARAQAASDAGDWSNSMPEDLFMPELIKRGWVIDIDVQVIHTGSYGELSLS